MQRLAITAYLWDPAEQDRLLIECVAPLAKEQFRRAQVAHLWFDRFDARGPHVFVVLTLASAHAEAVRADWNAALAEFLARLAGPDLLDRQALEERHAACRGKTLGVADTLPGLAANHTFLLHEHAERGYPFRWSAGRPCEGELWSTVDDLTFWSLEQLAEGHQDRRLLAAAWLAGLEQALADAGLGFKPFWHYCAARLSTQWTVGVGELEGAERAAAAALHPRQRALLDRVWLAVAQYGSPWPHMGRLVQHAVDPADRDEARRWILLRELVQAFLKGFGLYVKQVQPLFLYAWSRALAPEEVAGGSLPG